MEPTPTPSLLNLFVEARVPDEWLIGSDALIPRKTRLLTRDGAVHVISAPQGKFYLRREAAGIFRLTSDAPPAAPVDIETQGPLLWRELHIGMLTLPTEAERAALIDSIATRLPCGACKTHFAKLRKEMPADLRTNDTSFRSSWRWHNAVRKRQGKATMGIKGARTLYLAK